MTEQPEANPDAKQESQKRGVWQHTTERLRKILPVDRLAQRMVEWFSVREDRVAEILERVERSLPTTEAILIGKPQAGKSSIVRGLTGVSAEIVGQGFRPHTQHTERYAYPASELPLLIFTDTVGLGDVGQETEAIVSELLGDLSEASGRAKILILTVKINDFATESLRQIGTQLREKHPHIPCLLAVTCLHEVYPAGISVSPGSAKSTFPGRSVGTRGGTQPHPEYPPQYEEVQRAYGAIVEGFGQLCDRAILMDFTLEEDGYNPVFYGLEALRDSIAELLPEAEAQAIHQILDGEAIAEIGNMYRNVARRYIRAFCAIAATLAAVPLPLATMPVLTALQVSMVGLLGKLYGQTLTRSQAGGIVSAIAGGFVAQAIGRELIKFVPGFGSAIAASWAAAYTGALGEGACVYFGDIMGGKIPDPERIQAVMAEAFQATKERFKNSK
ncbi:MAG: 50S ribosome-binding GTPase [Hormoscilla sp. GM7CHS1pb]|nr:50S ribosome-binding GTPase [Hormoscilla sp. GM7CHS1pb]